MNVVLVVQKCFVPLSFVALLLFFVAVQFDFLHTKAIFIFLRDLKRRYFRRPFRACTSCKSAQISETLQDNCDLCRFS